MNLNLHPSIIDHWHSQHEDLQLSSNDFYSELEKQLEAKAFPNVTFKRKQITESWLLSTREYLVVSRFEYEFIICAAPFGRNFFFSWYMKYHFSVGVLLGYVPFIGKWLMTMALRKSYFEYDTEIMFQDAIKKVIEAALGRLTAVAGVRQTQSSLAGA